MDKLVQNAEETLQALRKMKNLYQREALSDGLTGLLSRKGWDEKSEEYINRAKRTGEKYVIAVADVDDLKVINDSLGHTAGDLRLKKVGEILMEVCRNSDILARIGGDEFAILLVNTTIEQAEAFKNRMVNGSLNESIKLSVGLGHDYVEADGEMYKMKAKNKNV